MTAYRNLGLLTKISVIVTLTLLAFFALATFLNYRQQKEFIVAEAVEKARIVAFEAIRTREYISGQLQQGGVPLSKERYGLIPVVAANRIAQQVAEDIGYHIRQTSLRFRNPANAPDPFEAEYLKRFLADPTLTEAYAIASVGGEPVFRYLRPFPADESCLECHGDPAQAPAFIKELFPETSDQAYHYQLGEVIGAASVSIPMDTLDRAVRANLRTDIIYMGGIFFALMTCLGLLVRVAVTRPLARLGAVVREVVRTGRFEEQIPRRGRDEIGSLIDGFNEMIEHLGEKTRHLEESEKRFRALTETARDGIISFLATGQVILFNRQAERIFGYSKREILGMSVERLIHEECTCLGEGAFEAALRREAPALLRQLNTLPGRRRDGQRIDLELSLSVAESDGHAFYTAILRERG
jgi:PAS domain S-box-containing protein